MNRKAFVDAARGIADFPWLADASEFLAQHMEQDGGHDFARLMISTMRWTTLPRSC